MRSDNGKAGAVAMAPVLAVFAAIGSMLDKRRAKE